MKHDLTTKDVVLDRIEEMLTDLEVIESDRQQFLELIVLFSDLHACDALAVAGTGVLTTKELSAALRTKWVDALSKLPSR